MRMKLHSWRSRASGGRGLQRRGQDESFVRVGILGSASDARAQVFVAAVGLLTTLPQEQIFSPMTVRFSMCHSWREWGCAANGATGE
jgi:hypothetical protein